MCNTNVKPNREKSKKKSVKLDQDSADEKEALNIDVKSKK